MKHRGERDGDENTLPLLRRLYLLDPQDGLFQSFPLTGKCFLVSRRSVRVPDFLCNRFVPMRLVKHKRVAAVRFPDRLPA